MAVVGKSIYVDSFDHRLYALDLETGAIRWRVTMPNILMSTPVVTDGEVIVGSGHDGFLRQEDPTSQVWGEPDGDEIAAFATSSGNELWHIRTVGEDMASGAIVGHRFVVANGDLHAYALAVKTGRILWRRPERGVSTMASATIIKEDLVVIGLCHNEPRWRETRAVNARTGRTLWRARAGSCDASATYDRGTLFVDGNRESENGPYEPGGRDVVSALNPSTGRTLWQHLEPPGPYTLVASGEHATAATAVGGVLYQAVGNRDLLLALDESSGKVLWAFHTAAPVKMSPVVVGARLIFGDTAGILYSVERDSGRALRTASFKDPFSTSPPIVVGQTLLIANGKYVFAIPLSVV